MMTASSGAPGQRVLANNPVGVPPLRPVLIGSHSIGAHTGIGDETSLKPAIELGAQAGN